MIIDDKVDIDSILVVTFTNAAASEMRERVLDAIYKKIEENPENTNLQRQINLLNKSSICTIDSFCLDVIKNNFYEIDVSANSRIADTTEITLLKQEILDDIFEEKYINNDKDFLKLIDTYTKYNRDEDLQNIIFKIYSYMQTNPFPEEWLNEKIKMFDLSKDVNFSETKWGETIIENANEILENCIIKLSKLRTKMQRFSELDKFTNIINEDIENYTYIKENINDWDKTNEAISSFRNKNWPSDKKITNELKDEAKEIRDSVKKDFAKLRELIMCSSEEAITDIIYMNDILVKLQKLILEFDTRFYIKKREKNIMDFNDIEHLALNILVKKDENGKVVKTDVAKKYENKFKEIAIDEYQDSNLVQEYILNSVSKGNNVFQVGDVKQSIYKFRQARPELFLEKYDKYELKPQEGKDRKIKLFKNFRSRENILNITNMIFKNIMSKQIGNIEYNEDEYLNLGANYEEIENQNFETKVEIIDLIDENVNVWKDEEEIEEDTEEEKIENVVLEARFVAKTIKELIDSKYQIIDKKDGKRDITFRDIAVLLRSPNAVAPIYEKEISSLAISVYSDTGSTYLQSTEIDIIMAVLKIINNPLQDIPLVTVMRSCIGNFTDNELLEISLEDKKITFYEKMLKINSKNEDSELKNKISIFLNNLEEWGKKEKYLPLDELIWQIYIDTGYMDYMSLMPNGQIRVANLKMLFERAKQYESASFKGLFNFINFIDKIKFNSGDLSSAKIIGENENVVKIMSIHKSKGLEFPVVILAGTGKAFNFQDLNDKVLLHQDLGLGPQYIDSDRHIEFKTLAKKAISIISKKEIISEEMRVLYVALTRAKEKLIIIGSQKDVNKKLTEKQKAVELYGNTEKINPFLVRKYNTYLDWIELTYLQEGIKNIKNIFSINIHPKSELIKNIKIKNHKKVDTIMEKIKINTSQINPEITKDIKEKLNWKYNFSNLTNIPTKTSVTKIKELSLSDSNIKSDKITTKPQFLSEDENQKLSSAQKGTLMHLCVQKMDEKIEYSIEKIEKLIANLIDKQIITKVEANSIDIKKLYKYTKSNLWNSIKNAKEVNKEQPFYINISAKEVYEVETDENILVQGIIDLYYINSDGKLYLVDYKTDYIEANNKNSLAEKYKKQMEIYKRALENSIGKKVEKCIIYSLYLNEEIEV